MVEPIHSNAMPVVLTAAEERVDAPWDEAKVYSPRWQHTAPIRSVKPERREKTFRRRVTCFQKQERSADESRTGVVELIHPEAMQVIV